MSLLNWIKIKVLNIDDYENRKDFCYEYKRGIWIDCEYGWMWLESRFDVLDLVKLSLNYTPVQEIQIPTGNAVNRSGRRL